MGAFHPEEAGIMLDRFAVELLHAQAKNRFALGALREAVQELLTCVGIWLAMNDPDELPVTAQLVAAHSEPGALAQTLRDLAEHLLVLDAVMQMNEDRQDFAEVLALLEL